MLYLYYYSFFLFRDNILWSTAFFLLLTYPTWVFLYFYFLVEKNEREREQRLKLKEILLFLSLQESHLFLLHRHLVYSYVKARSLFLCIFFSQEDTVILSKSTSFQHTSPSSLSPFSKNCRQLFFSFSHRNLTQNAHTKAEIY